MSPTGLAQRQVLVGSAWACTDAACAQLAWVPLDVVRAGLGYQLPMLASIHASRCGSHARTRSYSSS